MLPQAAAAYSANLFPGPLNSRTAMMPAGKLG